MRNVRMIARLDIKGSNLIKGIHLEGLRVIGSPNEYALNYYNQGIDELIYMDSVASLYGRNSLNEIVKSAAKNIFVPMTVGGGIRSLNDASNILRCGADKIAVNTEAVKNPNLIRDIALRFGSQCMVISVEAKNTAPNTWEVYIDNGRERTNLDVVEWTKKAVELGAGEILLTSIDQEGTRRGFDISLVQAVTENVSVPVIASGGMGSAEDLVKVVTEGNADAVAMADILHYERKTVGDLRKVAMSKGIKVRAL
jgi:imidazole glycerol-phosphate synthase subunit HisF